MDRGLPADTVAGVVSPAELPSSPLSTAGDIGLGDLTLANCNMGCAL